MKRAALGLAVILAILLSLWLGYTQGRKQGKGPWPWSSAESKLDPTDLALSASLPQPDPLAGLPASALDALLKPNLTPQQQTEIIGQLLMDYWATNRNLPNGTWEEICAQLTGSNKSQLALVPQGHPALGKAGFQSSEGAPGIRLHVISSSQAAFQLTYDGPDGKPHTEDDLIRSFPPDLEKAWQH
jgi:hypothetical protein